MTTYQISPKENKNIVDIQIYTKDNKTISFLETYRSGFVSFSDAENTDFKLEEFDACNPAGFDVGMLLCDSHDYIDCISNDLKFSESISPSEQLAYQTVFENQGFDFLANKLSDEGWSDDYETIFYGPLEIIAV